MNDAKQVAKEILNQLGGNKFIAMTGAKNFACEENRLIFKIGRNEKRINVVDITLNGMDTYDVQFKRMTKSTLEIISEASGIYNDMLQSVFTKHTGMCTHL